ncbi:hypothetical protein C815_00401 [Firmicutes bacterium M10-2]|nr:hypothetical protein C815_00401 [Firmicutes bacterium M10-2]
MKKRRKRNYTRLYILISVCLMLVFYFATPIDLGGGKEPIALSRQEVLENLSYGENPNETYDLYIPQGLEKGKSYPLLLFIHGGGWYMGDKSYFTAECQQYMSEGYICATMNYVFLSEGFSQDDELNDITQVMENINEQLRSFDLSVDEAALGGFSAGSQLSLLYAYSMDSPIPIRFVFVRSAPVSMIRSDWQEAENSLLLDYFVNEEQQRSPITYINEQSVPTLAVYPLSDTIIGTKHGQLLENVLTANNVPHTILYAPNSDHYLLNDPDQMQQFDTLIHEYIKKYF